MGITDKGAQPDELGKKRQQIKGTATHLKLQAHTTKDKTCLTLWHPNTYRWYISIKQNACDNLTKHDMNNLTAGSLSRTVWQT